MSLAEQFRTTVTEAFASGRATADLLPMVFVRAAVAVLPVSGAGLSMIDHMRIPLAASDQQVVSAERLQTTIGEGPCLTAVASGRPLVADLARMAADWPTFHERFVAETPYQSVAAFPLRSATGNQLGALDLYSTSPDTLTSSEVKEVDIAIAIPIASILFTNAAAGERDGLAMPIWLSRESVDERRNVWIAVGVTMERLKQNNEDTLALLRGYAYSHNLTLDEVARLVTDSGLQPEELMA
jgi:GAF domain